MRGKIYLTFDIDWASDEIIKEITEVLINNEIKSTWFVTHKSSALEIFRERDDFSFRNSSKLHERINPR